MTSAVLATLLIAPPAAMADPGTNSIALTIFGSTSQGVSGAGLSGQIMGAYNRKDPTAAPSVPASPVSLNTPVIQIRNESTSGAALTGFSLTINDNSHVFDWAVLESAGRMDGSAFNGLAWTQILPELPDNNSLGGLDPVSSVLQYAFEGFDVGEYFEFQTDIDPGIVDFRPILFNPATPATVSFTFSDGTSVSHALASGVSLAGPGNQRNFQIPLQIPALIPEPAFLQLGALGAMGAMGFFRARKRSTAER